MKIDYPKIKKILHIGIFSFDLLLFMIVLFSTDSSKRDYKPYTGSTLFFLDLYIIIIYGVLIAITIFPKLLYFILKKYILFIFTDKGKVIMSYSISLIYWFAANKPQFILGIILTLTSTILLIYEFIFYFTKVETFLTNKGIQFENKNKPYFDIEVFEKDTKNTTTPFSAKTPQNQNLPEDNKQRESYGESEHKEDKDENKDNNPEIRDVEISNGYDNKEKENNPSDNGFGF
jgi:hypothetical protein